MIPVSNHLRRWLMRIEIWRIVGFVSAVVGLLCYALSSSFSLLFGDWNFMKIFLYCVFSFIICFITLFAKVWQCSTSTLFKTRLAVLLSLATTVYSFFYDKALNQKPDLYILISCAAFAVMCISLSKQTQWGCEMDLANYFLGCLIILLMKINLWLFFIGAAFSYSLIIFSSSLDATPQSGFSEDHIVIQVQYSQVDSQHVNIDRDIQVDSEDVNIDSVIHVDSQDIHIDSATEVDSHHVSTDSAIKKDLLQLDADLIISQFKACISELKKKDRIILSSVEKYAGVYDLPNKDVEKYFEVTNIHLATDDNLIIDSLSQENLNSLQETVKKMMAAGFEEECCHMYISCRKKFLQKCLRRLQLPEFNSQYSLTLATHNKWMIASIVALRKLFPSERRLCDRIFFGFSSAANLSFMEVCRELTNHLLSLPNNLATESRCFSYLGSSLEVFRTLGDLTPEFESVFFDQYSVSLKNEAITTQKRLGEAIIVLFMELENGIHLDTSLKVVTQDVIDPTITYIMERCFPIALDDRDGTLQQILKEFPMVADREGTSSLSIQDWIMELLESNLEAKSKNYTDTAFAHVFLMNNRSYIVQNARFPRMLQNFGFRWMQTVGGRYDKKIQQNIEQYQRTWDKILELLKLDSNELVLPNVAAESMKEKLRLFNKKFKETCNVQSTWYVPNELLREKIRISIEKILLPEYGNFIARFQNLIGKHAYEYIEYGMFDIEALLNTLFQGSKRGSNHLSKQTQWGCEMDLANYFLGCLIILLMKINLWLFFIGAAFSYSLITFSSSLDATPQSGFSEDHIVIQVQYSQVDSQHVNIDRDIQVDSNHVNIDSVIHVDPQDIDIDRDIQKDLLQLDAALIISQFKACISALKKKDRIILHSVEKYVGVYNFPNNHVEKYFEVCNIHLATDDNLLIDSLSPENINSLQETVKKMVAAGFEKECCHMYISCRKKFLQKCLRRLQLSKFNSQESLALATHRWMIASIVALRILFPSERRLCDRIFFGFSSAANLSFMEVCRELTNHLLSLPNNLATESRCFSYLGSSLEVFRTLGDLTPEFESVFFDQYSVSLKNEAITIQKRLGEAIIVLIMELENDIHPDTSQKVVTEDGIDPTIAYTVEICFRVFMEDRRGTLQKIFEEFPAVGDREGTSSLSRPDWIKELLESNLEAKSKNYTDTAFAHVSIMNNSNYIVQNAIYPGLGEFNISSNDWKQILRGHNTCIQQNLEQYQRTWDKIVDLLRLDSNELVMPNVAAASMKEKLRLFNKQFKETCNIQSTWYVPNKSLREKIRTSIEKILLPEYGNFIARFQNLLGKHAYEYIEYGMFDIEALLNTLFQGSKKGSTKMLTAPISL
ncbi:unnamed protein product [Lupinus luteus]|uniref:Exocyst complex subunit Exo70 C-terminal domain-containing protein n=1 Tax=Lupinus luteus TaxID=3873 RepID=A0AAV1X2M1_LUPLU